MIWQVSGAILSVIGTLLLSLKGADRKARLLTFILYLFSNILLLVYYKEINAYWLIGMNLVFAVTSIIGILKNLKESK